MPLSARLVGPLLAGLLAALAFAGPVAAAPSEPVGGSRLGERGVVADVPPGVPAPPPVLSAAYVVADADSGQVLAAKAAHLRLPPASTLKTLTALTLLPRLDPRRSYVATRGDAAVEGSKAGVVPGGSYTVDQLWQAVFLRSGNDAVTCLTSLNGGLAPTLEQMRAKAAELGARDTTVVDPTGLDAPGQLTSAYDLALFGRAAVRDPRIVRYASAIRAPFPGKPVAAGQPRKSFQLWTQQKYVLRYDGALGIKNGFTTLARYTLIAAARRGDRTVVVTILRAPKNASKDAALLSDWAFRYGPAVRPVGTLEVPPTPPPAPAGTAAAPGAPTAVAVVPVSASSSAGLVGWLIVVVATAVVALRARVLVRRRRAAATGGRLSSGAAVRPAPALLRPRRTGRGAGGGERR